MLALVFQARVGHRLGGRHLLRFRRTSGSIPQNGSAVADGGYDLSLQRLKHACSRLAKPLALNPMITSNLD